MAGKKNPNAVELGRLGGLKGGPARAASLSPERRKEIAANGGKERQRRRKLEQSGSEENS